MQCSKTLSQPSEEIGRLPFNWQSEKKQEPNPGGFSSLLSFLLLSLGRLLNLAQCPLGASFQSALKKLGCFLEMGLALCQLVR